MSIRVTDSDFLATREAWEQQRDQFERWGQPGIEYVRGNLTQWGEWAFVDCLLWRDEGGSLRGILYHYPEGVPLERPDSVTMFVDPDYRRRGIGTALFDECHRRWTVARRQDYSPSGAAFARAYREREGGDSG